MSNTQSRGRQCRTTAVIRSEPGLTNTTPLVISNVVDCYRFLLFGFFMNAKRSMSSLYANKCNIHSKARIVQDRQCPPSTADRGYSEYSRQGGN
jgi:hypothetical protein